MYIFRFFVGTTTLLGIFFSGGGGGYWGGAKTLGGQIFTGGPLDSVFSPIFPKKIFACGGLKSMKSLGGGTPPPQKKNNLWSNFGRKNPPTEIKRSFG